MFRFSLAVTTNGGFSTVFSLENGYNLTFQRDHVDPYLDLMNTGPSLSLDGYPTDGRGIPDISAVATSYSVVIDGKLRLASGTSAACPVMAGITAR